MSSISAPNRVDRVLYGFSVGRSSPGGDNDYDDKTFFARLDASLYF